MLKRTAPFFFAPDPAPGGGAAAPAAADPKAGKAPSIDAQLTAANARIATFEATEASWNTERATLAARVTELEGQLTGVNGVNTTQAARITELEGQIAAHGTQVAALTKERDDAAALTKNPSAQAASILAQAGAPAMPTRVDATRNPAATKADLPDMSGKSALERATAKAEARAKDGKW